ncbi:hypothetical protein B0J13DRAFT_618782 [Dactylonectria estremocensis]|uniref:Uncharacterized protein n=1 Tax=Dactylonectria estremocensis TaxID=1079267 RepID=A0A9P9J959_9HYPO|nr:hypothetical protein B0J13DRAFT_618782 [Dactylonectria estremocensis]
MILGFPSLLPIVALLFSTVQSVVANTEKAIFVAPDPVNIPLSRPSLDDLNLHVLTPMAWSIRANLTRTFPAEAGDASTGAVTWLLLDHLTTSQRYEIRVCWTAIQPTAFTLEVYELDTVWDSPELIQSLAEYANSRLPTRSNGGQVPSPDGQKERKSSALLLQVRASADYFTDHAVLMQEPPPVLADLILDPYVYNTVPRSLLPTIGYLVLVSLVAWFVARTIASKLQSIAITAETSTKKRD